MLDINSLKKNLNNLTNPDNCPKTIAEAAEKWANMYHQFASKAQAGSMSANGLSKDIIKNMLMKSGDGNFYGSLGSSVKLYWSSAIWSGPGFSGVTLNSDGLESLLKSLSGKLLSSNNEDGSEAARKISNAIISHSKMIVVNMTNISSGITSPVNVI